jgi:DnaA family protein
MRQLTLALAPPRDEGLATVVDGPNAEAVAHLRELVGLSVRSAAGQEGAEAQAAQPTEPAQPAQSAEQPHAAPAFHSGAALSVPVYLWGDAGSGKTRLLRALAHEHHARGQSVAWFDPATPLPWQLDERHRMVLLDDADRLDTGRQHAAFALFIEAGALGLPWVAAGRQPPVDLPLRDDLRSRLGWGQVFALRPLDDAALRELLRIEGRARGLELKDDVIDFVMVRFAREPRQLMNLLDQFDDFALASGRRPTVPLLREMLSLAPEAPGGPA